ncbi:10703_t:CDS:2 [Acaulospora morrowiae]|uniref:10703_t:CDS:1 n=1 Tax=Acaulospora morrowiae TaxID=94023 RepID=A0A9N8VYW8_9GLOM|nr:10703_t:CDS:2 [Acaulospora morrowiae]
MVRTRALCLSHMENFSWTISSNLSIYGGDGLVTRTLHPNPPNMYFLFRACGWMMLPVRKIRKSQNVSRYVISDMIHGVGTNLFSHARIHPLPKPLSDMSNPQRKRQGSLSFKECRMYTNFTHRDILASIYFANIKPSEIPVTPENDDSLASFLQRSCVNARMDRLKKQKNMHRNATRQIHPVGNFGFQASQIQPLNMINRRPLVADIGFLSLPTCPLYNLIESMLIRRDGGSSSTQGYPYIEFCLPVMRFHFCESNGRRRFAQKSSTISKP